MPHARSAQLGVRPWSEPALVVTGKMFVGGGPHAVADPRHRSPEKFNNVYRVAAWHRPAAATTSSRDIAIAEPRTEERRSGAIGVTAWTDNTGTIAGESLPSNGSFAVADPRPNLHREKGDAYVNSGHYGVVAWSDTANTASASGQHNNGAWSIADPRARARNETLPGTTLPAAQDRLVAVIRSLDGTWHRPFTTLELAALQSFVDPEEHLELDGLSDADWRKRIRNAVPPDAATAIADTMGTTLLLAWSGETFMLSAMPIWVRQIEVALSLCGDAPQ